MIEEPKVKLVGFKADSLHLLDEELVVSVHKCCALVSVQLNIVGVKLELGQK